MSTSLGSGASRPRRVETSLKRAAEKFRRAREDAGLSLRQLGERAGLAPSTIQKIENYKIIPSLSVCIRLADALNRSISYFAEEEEDRVEVRLIPHGDGRTTSVPGARIAFEHIATPLVQPKMEAFRVTVQPGGRSGPEAPIIYRGEEIVLCTKGRLCFKVRGELYELSPGDTLHLKGDLPHSWENAGDRQAEMVIVCAFNYPS